MRQRVLMAVGLAGFLTVAACSKAKPVASTPAPPVPVASTAPSSTAGPSARRTPPAANSSTQSTAQNRRSATMTPQERLTLNDRLAKMEDALFDYDKSSIRPDAMTNLKDDVTVISGILSNYPAQKLVIQGGADERGSAEYNLALGDRRAISAEEFLVNMGIPKVQLTVISYGKDHPVCTDATENCWQRNRRAHITAAP